VNCEDTMKFSFTYLDDEFDARDKIEFETHLAMCGKCRQAVEFDAKFRDTVRKHLIAPPADPELRNRVEARLSSARRQARLSRTLTVPLALAASIALAVISYRGLSNAENPAPELPAMASVATNVAPPTADHGGALAERHSQPALAGLVAAARAPGAPAQVVPSAGVSPRAVAAGRAVRLVNSERPVAQGALTGVRGGGVRGNATAQDWPIAEARSASGLRTMVKMHATPLPDEVRGSAAKVQAYLGARMSGVGAPPIAEGTGVRVRGARFSQVAGHPVVVYRYTAFGKLLTALRFLKPTGSAPFDEPDAENAAGLEGTLDDHLAGYAVLHVLRRGVRYALVSEMSLDAMKALLDVP
jgi:hypothetical protein